MCMLRLVIIIRDHHASAVLAWERRSIILREHRQIHPSARSALISSLEIDAQRRAGNPSVVVFGRADLPFPNVLETSKACWRDRLQRGKMALDA
jgi:hypothetical protein